MNNYKISIIIPVYNTGKYLRKCLDSLFYQTCPSVEIIVIDDASSENIEAVCSDYTAYHNFVFLKNLEHLGPGGARNRGLDIAQGEYIGFCDSDDWLELNVCEIIIESMDKYRSDIGVIPMERIYDMPASAPYYICQYDRYYEICSDVALQILLQQYDVGIKIPLHCTNKVFRKNFLDRINAHFVENIYFQGKLFTLYTFLYAQHILCIPGGNYKHYKRQNSVIQSFDEKHIHDFHQSMLIARHYLEQAEKFEAYRFHYYKLCETSMDTIIKEIFQFVSVEECQKRYLRETIDVLKSLVSLDEYFEYATAEEIRRHLQPHMDNTILL